jgi:hypothetical protein
MCLSPGLLGLGGVLGLAHRHSLLGVGPQSKAMKATTIIAHRKFDPDRDRGRQSGSPAKDSSSSPLGSAAEHVAPHLVAPLQILANIQSRGEDEAPALALLSELLGKLSEILSAHD